MWAPFPTVAALLGVLLTREATAAARSHQTPSPDPCDGHWIDIWTAMPQLTEPANLPPPPYVPPWLL